MENNDPNRKPNRQHPQSWLELLYEPADNEGFLLLSLNQTFDSIHLFLPSRVSSSPCRLLLHVSTFTLGHTLGDFKSEVLQMMSHQPSADTLQTIGCEFFTHMLLSFPDQLWLHTPAGRDSGGQAWNPPRPYCNVKVLLFNTTSEGNSGRGMQAM